MGSFSWMKADTFTNTANILEGAAFKFLIPKEYGGGFIKDHYQDYGYLGHDNEQHEYDMYELLAFWNQNALYKSGRVKDYLQFNGDFQKMKKENYEAWVKTYEEFYGKPLVYSEV